MIFAWKFKNPLNQLWAVFPRTGFERLKSGHGRICNSRNIPVANEKLEFQKVCPRNGKLCQKVPYNQKIVSHKVCVQGTENCYLQGLVCPRICKVFRKCVIEPDNSSSEIVLQRKNCLRTCVL